MKGTVEEHVDDREGAGEDLGWQPKPDGAGRKLRAAIAVAPPAAIGGRRRLEADLEQLRAKARSS